MAKSTAKKTKSSRLSRNDENDLTKEDERLLKMERARIYSQEKAKEKAQQKVQKEIDELNDKLKKAKTKLGIRESLTDLNHESEDTTGKILGDIKSAYKSLDGKKKLKEIMKDDKQFANMIKEMLKLETALKIKGSDAETNQAVFVIIKGLADEKAVAELIGEQAKDIVGNDVIEIVARERDGVELLQQIMLGGENI